MRGRLFTSAAVFAVYVAADAARIYARLSPEFATQLRLVGPLLLAFGIINALVALVVNPWRENRLPDRFPTIVQDAVTIALFAIAAIVVLQEKVLATTAVGAVVIGFALQDTLGNLFAGLAIQIEKPFRVGNWVNVAGRDGMVTEISWRATKIRTKAGNLVVVPNSALARETITNYSEPNPQTRLDIDVGASYDTPPNDVKAAILSALAHEPLISHERPPQVIVVDFAASAVTYRVWAWIDDFATDEIVRDRVRSLIYYVFRRRGITIPYPVQVQIPQAPAAPAINPHARAAAVGAVDIFGGLSEEQRTALAGASHASVYSTGEVIVRQGEAGSSMFIVVSGEAVVTLEPTRQEVSRVVAGGFFGEMSLLTGAARTATVTATNDCEVLEITADAFRRFVLANPAVVEQVGVAVAKRAASLAELRTASEHARAAEPPASFIARARRFLGLSATVLAIATIWHANISAAERAAMQLPSADGRRVVTAIEAKPSITVDGILDEEVWQLAQPASGFVQAEPHEGQAATELTDVRLAFDRDALYIGVVCHDAANGPLIVNDIRKDFSPGEQDTFEVLLDTFADRRNGFVFVTNPRGAKSDAQIANEGRDVNTSWDAVWTVAARMGVDGWSAELRIPFKTLRFEAGAGRIWGVNFSRRIRRKNEVDYWSPVPRVYNLYRAGLAGTLTGLPDTSQGRNLRLKPWVAGNSTRPIGGAFDNGRHIGLDAKYGVTPSLTLDVTVRPDFAQAEADEQQVNLTQFSLFFPEKREFFLENSGMFYFGDIPRESRLGNARFAPPEEEMLLFFSRRIGLTATGREIPIAAGGRLTGRAGRTGVGAMTIQTKSVDGREGANYTVLRGRRDILRNSDIGAIFLSRQSAGLSSDRNELAGMDANFRFLRALSINGFLAKSASPDVDGGQMAGKGSVVWNDNRLHAQYSLLSVGDNFRDDIGFIKRTGIRKHFVDFGLRKRYEGLRKYGIRELHPHTRYNIYTDQSNVKVTHTNHVAMAAFFESGGYLEVQWNPRFERIVAPFKIRPDQSFAAGEYGWNEYVVELETNHSRKVSGSALATAGGFWNGTQKSTKVGVTVRPSYHLTFDLALQRNDIALPFPMHDFVTNLVTSRAGYAFSTRTFLDTLLQYNTDLKQFSANVRFDIIHRPLSDLFVVYNEQQLTDQPTPVNAGRGLIVKYTHMLAF